jgi:hypothetical protein
VTRTVARTELDLASQHCTDPGAPAEIRSGSIGPTQKPEGPDFLAATAKFYVAHGTADAVVPIESFDYLVTRLLTSGREDAVIRRSPVAITASAAATCRRTRGSWR